jgi:hypothetical protein
MPEMTRQAVVHATVLLFQQIPAYGPGCFVITWIMDLLADCFTKISPKFLLSLVR